MKHIFTILFSFFLALATNVAYAQDPERETSGETGVEIDWETIETSLAPLEQIQLEPPQLTNGEAGERQVWLYEGQLAPWDGVLLNPPAAAFIVSEYEAAVSRARAALGRQRASDSNRLRLEVGRLELQLRSEKQQFGIQIVGLQREILRLGEAHQALIDETSGNFWKNFLKVGGGILGGIVVGIIIGFFVGAAN